MEDATTTTNPMERIAILEAPVAEAKIGEALDATTMEDEAVGSIMIEGDLEIFTIESSLEWRESLIEE